MDTPSRVCSVCNTTFYKRVSLKRWNSNQGKYCSRKCFGESLKGHAFYRAPRTVWPVVDETLANGSVVHWSEGFHDGRSYFRVRVTCGACKKSRTIEATKTRGKIGVTFSGLCHDCNLELSRGSWGPGSSHPGWQGGVYLVAGYRYIHIANLPQEQLDLVLPMVRKSKGKPFAIPEHRLIKALELGRALVPTEVVHHRNGDKLDNRPENLEITTPAKHRQLDVQYFHLWQDALARISELEMELLRCKGERD